MARSDDPHPSWRDVLEEDAAAARLAMQRAKPLPPAPRTVGAALTRALAPILKAAGPAPKTLAERWPEIVGPRLAGVTEPIKVQRAKGGATLVVRAPSAAAPVILHAQKDILQRVSLATGAEIVALRIVHAETDRTVARTRGGQAGGGPAPRAVTPAERQAIRAEAEAAATTPALREALAALGEAVATERKPTAR